MNRLKEKLLNKGNLWHLGAIALFLLISSIYFYPALQGYTVKQGDVTNWVGMAQEIKDYRANDDEVGWTNAMFSGMPSTQISTEYKGIKMIKFLRDGMMLWLPKPVGLLFLYFFSFYILSIALKMKPIVGAVASLGFGFSSSMIVIIEAGHVTKAVAIGFAPLLIAGMIFAYRWKNWVLGVALSTLFMSLELVANHVQITYYMAFIMIGVGIAELVRYLKKQGGMIHFAKVTLALLVGYGIAIMINSGNILGTADYTEHTTRGGTELTITPDGSDNTEIKTSGLDREYITAWSYGKGETFTFIVPNFKGGETMRIKDNESNDKIIKGIKSQYRNAVKEQNQYWGDQPFTSGPVYLGIIVVFLALLGLIYSKDRIRWALLVVTLITVMLSWGKNFPGLTDFFLDNVPMYNKFRAVTIILAVAQLCVPLLGAMFLHRLIKSREEIQKNIKPFYIASGAMGLLLLGFLGAPGLFNSFLSVQESEALEGIADPATYDYYAAVFDELENARRSIFRKDVIRSLALMIVAFGAVFAFIRGMFNKYVLTAALAVLILFDMGMVDRRYLNNDKQGKNFKQWTESWKQNYPYSAGNGDLEIFNREIQKDPEVLFAVDSALKVAMVDFEGMDAGEKARRMDWLKFRVLNRYTNYRVFDLSNPFNSSYASYFHKSIGGYHGAKLGRYQELIEFHIGNQNPSVLDMLNARYQIASQPGPAGQMNSQFVKENQTAMGNAWFAKSVKTVANADEEIMAMKSEEGATISPGSDPFQVMVNGAIINGSQSIGPADAVAFLVPSADSSNIGGFDTLPTQVPFQAISELDLALIPGENGQLNWVYNDMLDSSTNKILIVEASGRNGWDPREETIVDTRFKGNLSKDQYSGDGTIVMTSYHPDNLVYQSSSTDEQLAVFSEIYYPLGWKAYIDGNEVPISRVNYVLRAIEVPAGDHKIEFVYDLESYEKSGTYANIGNILVILLFAAGIFYEIKRKDEDDEEEEEGEVNSEQEVA
jgi:hypothetical protein